MVGQQHGELVAAEAERLASLAQPRRDLREHAVARGVPVLVVDPLEVVDVDQAEAERHAGFLCGDELTLQPLVEVPVVAEPGQRVGERKPHRAQRAVRRSLVEGDRDQRPDERRREHRRALPQHHEHQGR